MPAANGFNRFARWRWSVSLVLAVLFLLFCGFHSLWPDAFDTAVHLIDGNTRPQTFSDLGAILTAGDCWRHGVDVYHPSPCMGGGIYNYAPLLLRAAYLPIGPRDTLVGGGLLAFAFIAALGWLPAPTRAREFLIRVFAAGSSSMFWLLHAANFDIVIFLLALLGIFLLLAGWIAGYAIFMLAAALKFYPVALLLIAARESPARLLAVICLAGLSLAAYMAAYSSGTSTAIAELPGAIPFHGAFGAKDIPFGLVLLHYLPVLSLEPPFAQYHVALTTHYAVLVVLYFGTKLVCLLVLLMGLMASARYEGALPALDETRQVLFLAGASVIVLCYLGAQNLDYRAVFLLLTLPGLCEMGQIAGHLRKRLNMLMIGMVLLLWETLLRNVSGHIADVVLPHIVSIYLQIGVWLAREILWFWVVTQLAALLICFLHANLARLARTLPKLTPRSEPNTNFVQLPGRRPPYA